MSKSGAKGAAASKMWIQFLIPGLAFLAFAVFCFQKFYDWADKRCFPRPDYAEIVRQAVLRKQEKEREKAL